MSDSDFTKICFKCKESKPATCFYRHPKMADGHLGKCKECTKADVQRNYQATRIKVALYDKKRNLLPERKAKQNQYSRRQRAKYPQKQRARAAVNNAIKSGRLTPRSCVFCGNPVTEAHHDDYSKPLDVVWVCFKCHNEKLHGKKCNVVNVNRKKGKMPFDPVKEKRCHQCKATKPRDAFYAKPASRTGLASWCKECASRKYKEYRNRF